MPNMVRNVRSLFARRFAHVWLRRSVMNRSMRVSPGLKPRPPPRISIPESRIPNPESRVPGYCSTTRCPSLRPLSTCVFVPLLTPTLMGRRSRWVFAEGR